MDTDFAMIEAMRDEIVKVAHPSRIVLFGSRAHGQARPDSDVDLLVVERESFGKQKSRRAEMRRIRQALARFRVPKDVLVYSEEEMNRWSHSLNHVIAVALREGRLLYERS